MLSEVYPDSTEVQLLPCGGTGASTRNQDFSLSNRKICERACVRTPACVPLPGKLQVRSPGAASVRTPCSRPERQHEGGPCHICISFRIELFPEEAFVPSSKVLIDVVFKPIKS